jgi:hypothetical protein
VGQWLGCPTVESYPDHLTLAFNYYEGERVFLTRRT